MLHKGRRMEPHEHHQGHGLSAGEDTDSFGHGPQIREELAKRLPYGSGLKVLDVGTGFGRNVLFLHERLRGCEIWSMDPSEEVLERVKEALREKGIEGIRLVKGSAEDPPFDQNTFDLVVSVMVLHHLEDAEKGVEGMVKVLKPGGHLLIADWAPSAHDLYLSHAHKKEDFLDCDEVASMVKSRAILVESLRSGLWYLIAARKASQGASA